MRDRNYCISKFRERFMPLKGKKLAFYGEIKTIQEIFYRYPEFKAEYIVNDNEAGKYVDEYYILAFTQVIELEIEDLILIEDIYDSFALFEKFRSECKYNHINIYNFYGQSMYDLSRNILLKRLMYGHIKENDLKEAIDKNDVISFDIDNTLFAVKYIYYSDFYAQVEKKINEIGVNIYDFADRIDIIRQRDRFSNLRSITEKLSEELCLTSDELETIWGVIINEARKAFVPRMALIGALMYAISTGKTVCIVDDMPDYRLPKEIWNILLNDYAITKYDFFVSSLDFSQSKKEGLYKNIIKKYGEQKSYLHIGDEIEYDILWPYLYNMDTFWIKSPMELFNDLDPIALEQLESKRVRAKFGKYLSYIYTDIYLFEGARWLRLQSEKLSIELQNEINLCKNSDKFRASEPITYEPVLYETLEKENIEEYPKLVFPIFEVPKVSIIIPVYNNFHYTYNCLKAILEHTKDVAYEVIIADDCSNDYTKEIESFVSGLVVLHNNENMKFLLNCNNASRYAKGEYILLLNNDTQVQPNWLLPLVSLIESDQRIGMVGAKLVYPDGRLQEAGGILWNNGGARNYGNGENPESYEYCYVKEVDYISGAAIMIIASLWKKIGGFDTIYSPGYYEDTDLAFEVRMQGYKVCLQPQSVVVHFEGVSNGTDLSEGLKKYQDINQQKFYEKWKDILKEEHFSVGTNIYLAKDRGQKKKQILVVDHYVPNYDKDAGGRCTFMYIKTFLKMGMKVTFIGDKFVRTEPYTTVLMQMGVEVMFGDFCRTNWQQWLKENLKFFDYIYLQRPNVSNKYIDLVKEFGCGKIFYFAHDLYHVRFYRDYKVTGNQESLGESRKWEKIELELFEKADVGHVVGTYEQELLQKVFPDKPIRNIPLYIYEDFPEAIEKDFSKRRDIIFVGGFNHKPNLDAVLWFANEVYPGILEKYPDMIWHIVGSNIPKEVQEISNSHIILEGFVTDEQLERLYRECRMAIVPLRYGAGVKGKVVEAAYYQIPMVTTSIGGEGLDSAVGSFVMENDADRMADLISNLYTDFDKLKEMSDAGKTFIQKYFTPKVAEAVLRADMNL